jgi:drug/metabolite transporter (DMT)-like permease
MYKKNIGILTIFFASLIWAIEPIFAKLSFQNSNFIQTSAIRAIFASLTAILYITFIKKKNMKIQKKNIPVLIYIAIIGTLLADFIYFFALTKVPVINAVVIGHMQPIFIILLGFFLLKTDKLNKFDYLGILLMIISSVLVTSKTLENLSNLSFGTFGDILVLFATIAWATTAIAMRKYIKHLNPGIITFYRFFIASLFFIPYLLLNNILIISNIFQIILGLIIGIGTIMYYEGLKILKAAQVSGLELTTPFFAAALGYIILGEIITFLQTIGIFLLFIGVYYLSKKENNN